MIPLNEPHHIGWIDYAKVFAIFSVVFLHTYSVPELSIAIKRYAMPLFFFISGFLFSRKRNPEFRSFLYKRFRQLIVPYFWINIVAYLIWLILLRDFRKDAMEWHEPLWGIALGIPKYLTHDIPLWSLLCFFVVEIIYYLLPKYGKDSDLFIAVCSFLVASVISISTDHKGISLPLTLAPCAGALTFYALGHFFRINYHKWKYLFSFSPGVFILACGIYGIGSILNIPISFFMGKLGNPLFFFLGAIGGILITVQSSALFEKLFHDGRLVRLISRGTLIICGFHLLAFSFIKGIMFFGFDIKPDIVTSNLFSGVLFSTCGIVLCFPLIWIIEKRFSFLVYK